MCSKYKVEKQNIMMSAAKTLGKIIGGFLLAVFLSMLLSTLAFSQITSYNNIKPIAEQAIKKQISSDGANLTQAQGLLVLYCKNSKSEKVNIPNTEINVSCADLISGKDMISLMTENMLNSIYYKNYTCDFLNCIKTSPLVLLSEKANKFFNDVSMILFVITIISAAILYFSCDSLKSRLKAIGSCLFVSGLPYFLFLGINNIPLVPKEFMPAITELMKPIQMYFLIVLAIGILMLVAGFIVGMKKVKK